MPALNNAARARGQASLTTLPTGGQVLVMLRLPPPHFHPEGDYGSGWDVQPGRRHRRKVAERIAADLQLRVGEDWSMPSLGVACFVMELPADADTVTVLSRLEGLPEVESAEPMHEYRMLDSGVVGPTQPRDRPGHDDPLFSLQSTASQWHLAELHGSATGRGVTVAVIDSAVDLDHADLRAQVVVARDFVDGKGQRPEDHGTAVAGIIVAQPDNQVGIAGVAPGARLLALRACRQAEPAAGVPQPTTCRSFALAKALQFAIEERANVINLSLTGPPDRLLARLIDVALERGTSVVAATIPASEGPAFPASHAGVIAVASDAAGASPGAVSAPGRDIPTTLPAGRWGLVSGSSFAAAEVSGLNALLREL
jgi:subtilisin family serine protease